MSGKTMVVVEGLDEIFLLLGSWSVLLMGKLEFLWWY